MRFLPPYRIISASSGAAKALSALLTRLTGSAPFDKGYLIQISVLPPAHDAPRDGGDERFTIDANAERAILSAHSVRGAHYAVYAFAEDYLGCRFWTAEEEYFPAEPELALSYREYRPAFSYREAYWRGALDGEFAIKMRLNSARADISPEQGGRVRFYNYSHSFEELVPPGTYFDGHPEYFSFFDGKRQKDKSQLCLTNKDVLALVIKEVKRQMREHPECSVFSVAQNDWYGYCTCDACRALDEREGSHAGTMLSFVNQVADAVREEFPQNFIHTFAYLYTRTPPKTIVPRNNVIIRLCSIECCFSHAMDACDSAIAKIDVLEGNARVFSRGEKLFIDDLAAWGKIAPNLYIWDYTTNYANYLAPFPNFSVLAPNLRLMLKHHVTGVFEQGNYAPGRTSAFAALKVYLLSHLMWDPWTDVSALTADFLQGYYGDAAPFLSEYITVMTASAKRAHMGIFDAADAPAISDEALKRGCELMTSALAACLTEETKRRVRLEKLSTDYLYLVRLPLGTPRRSAMIDEFAAQALSLGVAELFERRSFKESVECMKNSRCAKERAAVPYSFYRL